MVEFALETDFAARTDDFRQFSHDVALHITATNPASVSALLKEPFVKDPTTDIAGLLRSLVDRLSEQVVITRFVRWGDDDPQQKPRTPPDSPAVAMRIRA